MNISRLENDRASRLGNERSSLVKVGSLLGSGLRRGGGTGGVHQFMDKLDILDKTFHSSISWTE